jgi:hypothetical protein
MIYIQSSADSENTVYTDVFGSEAFENRFLCLLRVHYLQYECNVSMRFRFNPAIQAAPVSMDREATIFVETSRRIDPYCRH